MRDLVAAAPVARLATRRPNGELDLVPVTFALDGDEVVTAVDHKPKRTHRLARLDNVRAEPQVTFLVDHYDDDWDALWWVRLRASATVEEPGSEAHARAAALLAARYEQYRGRPPEGPAIVARVTEWRGWSAR